jgi:salicylate hydroxylase
VAGHCTSVTVLLRRKDRQFAALKEKKGGAVPDKWADADVQKQTYGEDVMKTADERFNELYAKA